MATYNPLPPISLPFPQPVTALAFDPVSDILWTGSNSGHVASYYGAEGNRGVSFRAGSLAVQKICPEQKVVRALSVSGEGVGTWAKGGMNKWFHRSSDSFTTFAVSAATIAAADAASGLAFLSPLTGTVMRQAPTPSMITHMEFSHSMLVSGSADGLLRTHDPRTGAVTGSRSGGAGAVHAYMSGFLGLQTSGNFVFTIGMSTRQNRPFPDPLVKLYDIRTMRALPPIPFSSTPAFINVVPKRPSTIAITSNQGLINIVDATNPSALHEFYQLDVTSYITSMALSPTGQYLACGDADGMIHLRTQVGDTDDHYPPFNGFEGQPIEWADPPETLPGIPFNSNTPLNAVGMPHYTTPLLSGWTPQFAPSPLYYPPAQKIPEEVAQEIKTNDNVAYARLPKELKGKRNLAPTAPKKTGGRFRSAKSAHDDEDEPDTPGFHLSANHVPKAYRHVEIEYSKFGVEDFDFAFYNQTEYSGLETHILNSYTNPMLQVMHYSLPVRQLAKSHITTSCQREHCLLCELGFVSRMLEDANGTNCQSSNFCKTVGVLANLSNHIDLIDYGRAPPGSIHYAQIIQLFHRFLIDHLSDEGNHFPSNPIVVKGLAAQNTPFNPAAAPITQLFGIDAKNVVTCQHCMAVRDKDNMTHIIDLAYPRRNDAEPQDFITILRSSLLKHMSYKATCQTCGVFSTFSSQRSIPTRDLPQLLAVNAGVVNEDNFKFWTDREREGQTFLKPRIEIAGQVAGVDDPNVAVYELRSIIAQIQEKDGHQHLVAIVKIPQGRRNAESESSWYLFNDFVVENILEDEALSFPGSWKTPAVLHFERMDSRDQLDFSELPFEIDTSILHHDTSISLARDPALIRHECLGYDELPTPGTLVAIDAEFVSMQQEESEYRSDGTSKIIRPARLSLARVSVLRGDGPKQSVPFIDDHIHTSEVIVDYLTEYSGIRFGDLDPVRSPHTLTPLKLVYKKLRLLVDKGCIFIGHGLKKDFRIINIFVPPEQVIDTVDLYFLKARQRRLSLRFLSWYVLNENIQEDTHDSIEDARSALNLYNAFIRFEEEGVFDKKLEEIYREGRQYNFKPPTVPSSQSAPVLTPRAGSPVADLAPSASTSFLMDSQGMALDRQFWQQPKAYHTTPHHPRKGRHNNLRHSDHPQERPDSEGSSYSPDRRGPDSDGWRRRQGQSNRPPRYG